MEFKINSNIFKNTPEDQQRLHGDKYDPNKNYPNFTGTLLIPEKEVLKFVTYLQYAVRTELKRDEYIDDRVIPIKISGWAKEAKSGKKFLSLAYAPDYKTMMAAKEVKERMDAQSAQSSQAADESAANLAKATAGTVVKAEQEEIF